MRATEFLTTLWGPTPPGLIQLWTRERKTSHYLRNPIGADVIAHTGRADVYTGVGLAHKDHGRHKRARAGQVLAIAGLWLDIDVNGGPDSKTGAAPDKDAALGLANALHAPTLIVDSGYGLHAWWLLDEPWRFADVAEQQQAQLVAIQWYALHRAVAQRDGWGVDHTHDLARLLRVPGTLNAKNPADPRPVEVVHQGGPRYSRARLIGYAAQAGEVEPASMQGSAYSPAAVIARIGVQPPAKLGALVDNSPEFADTLAHDRGPGTAHWTQSEWDLSLAAQTAQAGWSDQEIADLIAWDRVRHGKPEKAQRERYLRSTIGVARSRADRAQAGVSLERLSRIAA